MFKRVLYENWTIIVPVISFILTFSVFLVIFIHSLLLKKETVDRLATLALDEDSQPKL